MYSAISLVSKGPFSIKGFGFAQIIIIHGEFEHRWFEHGESFLASVVVP